MAAPRGTPNQAPHVGLEKKGTVLEQESLPFLELLLSRHISLPAIPLAASGAGSALPVPPPLPAFSSLLFHLLRHPHCCSRAAALCSSRRLLRSPRGTACKVGPASRSARRQRWVGCENATLSGRRSRGCSAARGAAPRFPIQGISCCCRPLTGVVPRIGDLDHAAATTSTSPRTMSRRMMTTGTTRGARSSYFRQTTSRMAAAVWAVTTGQPGRIPRQVDHLRGRRLMGPQQYRPSQMTSPARVRQAAGRTGWCRTPSDRELTGRAMRRSRFLKRCLTARA